MERIRAQTIINLPLDPCEGVRDVQAVEGNLLGSVTFQDPGDNFLVAVPLHDEGGREFVFGHVVHTSEDFSSLALLNSSNQKRLVSVEVFDSGAQRTGITFMELAAGQKIGRLVNEFFPDLEDQAGGFIRVRSNGPISGVEIIGDRSLNYMGAVSAQILER